MAYVTHVKTLMLAWVVLGLAAVGSVGCLQKPDAPPAPAIETKQHAVAVMAPGFQESVIWQGLNHPTAVRFSPDGRVFVAEKRGRIQVFDSVTDTTPTEFANFETPVYDYWDRGLLSIALHPEFPTKPYVYALYSLDAPIGGTPPVYKDDCPDPPGGNEQGCVTGSRLVRFEAQGNVAAGPATTLLEGFGQQYPSHSIGNIAFGADGALYLSSGDGSSFTFIDYGQRGIPKNPLGDPPGGVGGTMTPPKAAGGSLRSQSLRREEGPVLLNGAILRLDPMTGAALPTNPLFANPDDNAKRIVAYGLRNPFRFAIRPGTSEVWVGDVGYNTWEEINRVVNATDAVIENFGWPCYEGVGRQPGYDGANLDLCESLYTMQNGATSPHYTYDHGEKVVPGEDCKTGNSSVSAMTFYNGDKYPPKYKGALFWGDYSRNCTWAMLPGADGVPDPKKIETFGVDTDGIVDIQVGPDGLLYFADLEHGEIKRITYLLPKAVATADPVAGPPPLIVAFDGSASTKPLPQDTLSYAWDLDGDGQFDDSMEAKPTKIYETAGTFTARLQVTDQRGVAAVSDPITIMASTMPMTSTPPVPVIDTPTAATTWKVGDTISFTGHATDAEDGPLPATALEWMLVMQHCPAGCHAHVIKSWTGVASGSFTAPDHEYPSHIQLVLVAKDSGGLRRSTSIDLNPKTVFVTMQSQPPGLELTLAAEAKKAPFGQEFIQGGTSSVSAAPAQTLAGQPYAFVSWSNSQPATHDIGPLAMPQTLVAQYRPSGVTAQYFADLDLTVPALVRVDPQIDFEWARESPGPAVPETFSTRWTGYVLPQYSEAYTFATDADDGIRVFINGTKVLDSWYAHGVQRDVGTPVMLTAGQKAKIVVEYFDDELDAVAKLYWSSTSLPIEIVPTGRLYPACVAGACPNGLSCVADECVAQCTPACPAGQRCEAGKCIDACKDVKCGDGKCVAGVCVPKCEGVTCPAGSACEPKTGQCESACSKVMCPAGQACSQGACKPACAVTPCMDTEKCNMTSGACEPKCKGVTCQAGLACDPKTGACQDKCALISCPGQACSNGECKPTCVVAGCGPTETCNSTTGVCDSKCKSIMCAPGMVCGPTTGQCEPICTTPPCPDAGVPPDMDAGTDAPVGVDGGAPGTGGIGGGDAGRSDADGGSNVAGNADDGCSCDLGAGHSSREPRLWALALVGLALVRVRRRARK